MKKIFTLIASCLFIGGAFSQTTLVTKDFDDNNLTSGGWTAQTIVGTQADWYVGSYLTSFYAKISNYDNATSTNYAAEVWFISPEIDLTSVTSPILNFDNVQRFSGNPLQVLVSTNYDGTSAPSSATWSPLSGVTLDTDVNSWSFVNSGNVDLSAYIGQTIHIGYEYIGGTTDGSTIELDNIVVTATPAANVLTVALSAVNATCGNSDGSVSTTITNGTMPYVYVWSNGATTMDITGVPQGSYSVTVTDASSSATATAMVNNSDGPTISVSSANVSATGLSDGTATVTANGGTTPYTYAWSNGATATSIAGLVEGTYSVTVTAGSCTSSAQTTVGVSGANTVSIYDIQYTTSTSGDSPLMGDTISTTGIVTGFYADGYFIQDAPGAWNGIYVFDATVVAIGDQVSLTAVVDEFFTFTELKNATNVTINSTGNASPAPLVVATGSVATEANESVLVQVLNATSGAANNFGEWSMNDGSGSATANDLFFAFSPTPLTVYNVTGVVDYSFGNFLIEPRDINDIDSVGQGTAINVSIYEIQYTTDAMGASPLAGSLIETQGIVTAIVPEGYYIQDGDSAWSGIYVFDTINVLTVNLGDSILLSAQVDEFFDYTELKAISSYTVLNSGNAMPAGYVIPTSDVNTEAYESVLIQVVDATAGVPNNFGEWSVNDGSGSGLVDDLIYSFTPTPLTNYNVTGVINYAYSKFLIEPRDINDIDSVGQGTASPATIYEIQYTADANGLSPMQGQAVITKGIVTAIADGSWIQDQDKGYYIQDGDSAWSGIYVADFDNYGSVSIGDSVEITGAVVEDFDYTRIEAVSNFTSLATGGSSPTPIMVSTDDVNSQEKYESVLVKVASAKCTFSDVTNNFGVWKIFDGSDTCNVDNDMYSFTPTLNNEYTVTGVTNFSYGERKLQPRMASDIEQTVTIYDIQYTTATDGFSPMNGQSATTQGVVTAKKGSGYFIQDGTGMYSGIFVKDATNQPAMGDMVSVGGEINESFGMTELRTITAYTNMGAGTMPTPENISTGDVSLEGYESVLVKVSSANCTNADVASNNGIWRLDDNSGETGVDDDIYIFNPVVNTNYDVTGPVVYSFQEAKILPRMASDIVGDGTGGANGIMEATVASFKVFPNPTNGLVTIELFNAGNTSVVLTDITGKTMFVKDNITTSNYQLDLSGFAKGTYLLNVNNSVQRIVLK